MRWKYFIAPSAIKVSAMPAATPCIFATAMTLQRGAESSFATLAVCPQFAIFVVDVGARNVMKLHS